MSKMNTHAELGLINKKVVRDGEVLPEVQLSDGSYVQTGTVATMLKNIQLYNEGHADHVKKELILAIPTLFKIGLFELFPIDEWITEDNKGRTFVGQQAKKYLQMQET